MPFKRVITASNEQTLMRCKHMPFVEVQCFDERSEILGTRLILTIFSFNCCLVQMIYIYKIRTNINNFWTRPNSQRLLCAIFHRNNNGILRIKFLNIKKIFNPASKLNALRILNKKGSWCGCGSFLFGCIRLQTEKIILKLVAYTGCPETSSTPINYVLQEHYCNSFWIIHFLI